MSEENLEIARTAFQAFVERDADAFAECFAPDAELLLLRNLMEGGSYKGLDGVKQALTDVFETWGDVLVDVEDIRAVGDKVVARSRITNVGRAGTPTVEYEGGQVATLRRGKIIYMRPYTSYREALQAAGLSE